MRYFQYFLPYYSEIPLLFSTSGSNIGIQNLPLGKKRDGREGRTKGYIFCLFLKPLFYQGFLVLKSRASPRQVWCPEERSLWLLSLEMLLKAARPGVP